MNTARSRRVALARAATGHLVFAAVMIGASALTFLRMTAVALLLPIADFALYATVVAAGAFLAGPLSFGRIEATIKSFPRLVADGDQGRMMVEARAIRRVAVLRALALAVPLLVVGYLSDAAWARLAGLAMLIALGNAANSLVASMQRAVGSPSTLAGGTALRAGVTFAAVSLAALGGSLMAVIAVEIASMIAAALVSEWLFFRRASDKTAGAVQSAAPETSGRLIFLAFTAVAAPFYLDRFYVTTTMGEVPAAQYAVLALILLAASLLVNTIAQRAGPDAIRRIYLGLPAEALKRILGWIAAVSAIWLIGVACFGAILANGWLPSALERYAIAPAHLLPLAATGVLLNTALLEFLLIGMDREREFARAAAVFLALVLIGALAVYLTRGGLLALMWSLAACRAVYAAVLLAMLRPVWRAGTTGTAS